MDSQSLLEKLKSPHPGEVAIALDDIAKQNNMHDLSLTIGMIRNSNTTIRRAAIRATVSIIRNSIISNYHTLGPEGRQKLAKIIDKIHPETIQDLVQGLHTPNEETRIHSLMILGLLREKPNIKRIIESQLTSKNERIRATAVQALGNYPSSTELTILLKELNDQDERVRANAIEALEQFGDTKLIYSIKRLVHDGNNRVRANALKAIYTLGETDIEDDILTMLTSKDTMMISSALWLITQLGIFNDKIHRECETAQEHPDPVVQRNAQSALKRYAQEHYSEESIT